MTTSAAENKEKVEKRRALGRGLESLLPGPRVVPAAGVPSRAPVVPASSAAAQTVPAPQGVPVTQELSAPAVVTAAAGDAAPVPSDTEPIEISAMAEPGRMPANLVVQVAISDIDKNPFQTRYVCDDDRLEELADSIKANGVVQPIVVRPSEEDPARYVLIIGERRLHASKKAGKTTIPALVRRVSLQQAAEMTIIENLQRDDLSPIEQAQAFKVLSQEFSLTQTEIGARVGLSRESVANYMRLLKLPETVTDLLAEQKLSFAHARALLQLESEESMEQAALYAIKKTLTVDQLETLVMRMNGLLDPVPDMPGGAVVKKKTGGARWVDPNVRAAQLDLERMLGVRVKIRDRKGKGRIVIEYSTVDDYERVVGMLRGKA